MPRIKISNHVAIVCYPGSFAPLGPLALVAAATGRRVKVPPSDILASATGWPISTDIPGVPPSETVGARATSLRIRLGIIAGITWKIDAT
jgi:hypothetical protein